MKDLGLNAQGNQQFSFEATLVALGTTVLQNSNGKNYRLATVRFADINGEIQTAAAAIYEGNYNHASLDGKGLELGKGYLTTATIGTDKDGKPAAWLQMSHLEANAGRASVSMFLAEAAVIATAKVGSLAS